jgi:hypothetical protein
MWRWDQNEKSLWLDTPEGNDADISVDGFDDLEEALEALRIENPGMGIPAPSAEVVEARREHLQSEMDEYFEVEIGEESVFTV